MNGRVEGIRRAMRQRKGVFRDIPNEGMRHAMRRHTAREVRNNDRMD